MNTEVRALVTGGAGFIGSHLVQELLISGYQVTVIDNFATGKKSNMDDITAGSFRLVSGSILDESPMRQAFEGVDVVFHLAALADIVPSISEPVKYFETNVTGTLRVMEAAREHSVKKVVYAASSSCYGIPDQYPTPEDSPIKPQYPYALTKWLGEEIVKHWGTVYGIPYVSLRLFNVYGPRARTSGSYGAVMGVFLAQRLAGKPLTIVGDGNQARDFTHVRDVARAMVLAGASAVESSVLNVGTGTAVSINELASRIGGETVNIPHRPGEPEKTQAATGLISESLGWSPEVSFKDGVAGLVAEIEKWADAPVWDAFSIARATRDWFAHLG